MKLPYFKLQDAFDDVRRDFSYGGAVDKASSVARLLGKTVANVGMLSAEASVEIVKKMPEMIGKTAETQLKTNKNLTPEQRSKLEDIVEKSNQHR